MIIDSFQIAKPFLIALCYVLFLFLVVTTVPPTTFATLDPSSNQPEPGPGMQLPPPLQPQQQQPPQPQQDRSFIDDLEERLIGGPSPQHLVLNLTEQITFQEATENTPSPFELTMSSDQRSANIVVGETAQATLTVDLASGNTQPVTLSCDLSPVSSEASCDINPSVVTPNGTATLRITTEDTISPGQYAATITATPERGINQTTIFVVAVEAEPDYPPVISIPFATIQVNASNTSGAQVQYQASATDDVDSSINLTCTPTSGSTFPIGETLVTCEATDSSGNAAKEFITVTVNPPSPDPLTAEIISNATEGDVPATFLFEANVTGGTEPYSYGWNFGDDASMEESNEQTVEHAYNEPGNYIVTVSVTDANDQDATDSLEVTVIEPPLPPDTILPVITVPRNLTTTEQATSPNGAKVPFEVSAQDNVDGSVEVSCDHNSGSTFPIGETLVTCEATDSSGNSASKSFTITVIEDIEPVISGPPTTPIEVEATDNAGKEVIYTVTAVDKEDGNILPQCDPPSGTVFRIGETAVTCSVEDNAGNSVSKNFSVIVKGVGQEIPLLLIILLIIVAAIIAIVVIILLIKRRRMRSSTDVDSEGTRVY